MFGMKLGPSTLLMTVEVCEQVNGGVSPLDIKGSSACIDGIAIIVRALHSRMVNFRVACALRDRAASSDGRADSYLAAASAIERYACGINYVHDISGISGLQRQLHMDEPMSREVAGLILSDECPDIVLRTDSEEVYTWCTKNEVDIQYTNKNF